MKIKDFTIQFEKDEFKTSILNIITHDMSQKFNGEVAVIETEAGTTVTIKGEQDFDKIREIMGVIRYWRNVQ